MYPNTSSTREVAGISETAINQPARRPSPGWPAESWNLTPAVAATAEEAAGPHARPVVVMLGLFTACGSCVSAVMLEEGAFVWLDLITRGGSRATPLAVVSGLDDGHPHAVIEAGHRHWADRPEIRWHLAHQTVLLYRTYLSERHQPTDPGPHSSTRPGSCPEPRPHPTALNRSATRDTSPTGEEG